MKRILFLFCLCVSSAPIFASDDDEFLFLSDTESEPASPVSMEDLAAAMTESGEMPSENLPILSEKPIELTAENHAKTIVLKSYFPNVELTNKDFSYLQEKNLDDSLMSIGAQLSTLSKCREAIENRTLGSTRLTALSKSIASVFDLFFGSLDLFDDPTARAIYFKFFESAHFQLEGVHAATTKAVEAWKNNAQNAIVLAAVSLALAVGSAVYVCHLIGTRKLSLCSIREAKAMIPTAFSFLTFGTAGVGVERAHTYDRHRSVNSGLQDTIQSAMARFCKFLTP